MVHLAGAAEWSERAIVNIHRNLEASMRPQIVSIGSGAYMTPTILKVLCGHLLAYSAYTLFRRRCISLYASDLRSSYFRVFYKQFEAALPYDCIARSILFRPSSSTLRGCANTIRNHPASSAA